MKRTICCLSMLFLAGCASTTPLPEKESLAARIYAEKCGLCHSVPHPGRHTFEEWQRMVNLMEQRMAEQGIDPPLTTDEEDAILNYLKRHARK